MCRRPTPPAPAPGRADIICGGPAGCFLGDSPAGLPAKAAAELEARGSRRFEQIADYPGLVSFWWPRFRRIAAWIAANEPEMRKGVERVVAEHYGAIPLMIRGEEFRLSCQADRIDLLADGGARIIDYKTGAVPSTPQVESGLSPQLTLQAAILARGGFRDIGARETREISYVKLSGGDPAGEVKPLDVSVMELAQKHLGELEKLLTAYASPAQPYYPRAMMEKEEAEGDYDHLSRFREWALSGDAR